MYEELKDPRGRPLINSVYFDSDHAHGKVTRQSVSVVLYFVGSTPISWCRKRQGAIKTSSYSADFCTGLLQTE